VTAVRSGIMNLPFLLAIISMSISSGALVSSLVGYYVPFMISSAILIAIGSGLLSTVSPSGPQATWIGYQVIAGLGVGLGIQQSNMAVMTVLQPQDIPIGTGIILFFQSLGGGLTVAIAQAVFQNKLIASLSSTLPEIRNPATFVVSVGATELNKITKDIDGGKLVARVQGCYQSSLMTTFLLAAGFGAMAVVPALLMEWRSMKIRKK
jgi:hypothetical protein